MTDITNERLEELTGMLRECITAYRTSTQPEYHPGDYPINLDLYNALCELKRRRGRVGHEEIERYRAALEVIKQGRFGSSFQAMEIAEKALKGKNEA